MDPIGDARRREAPGSTAGRRLPARRRSTRPSASSRICLAGASHVPLLIELRQFSQALLESLPRRHAVPRRVFGPFRHVVACGLAVLPPIADVQVWTMLGSATPLAM